MAIFNSYVSLPEGTRKPTELSTVGRVSKNPGDQYPTIQYVTQSGKGSRIRTLKPDIWRHLPSGND